MGGNDNVCVAVVSLLLGALLGSPWMVYVMRRRLERPPHPVTPPPPPPPPRRSARRKRK